VTLLRAETAIGHVEIGYGMAAPAIAAALNRAGPAGHPDHRAAT